MKKMLVALVALAFVASFAVAADEAAAAAPAAKDMVLKGTIAKVEAEKDGKKVVTYTLTTAEGDNLAIPAPKDGIKDDQLSVEVEVAAKVEMDKEGKKVAKVVETVSVKVVVKAKEAAAEAPAAK